MDAVPLIVALGGGAGIAAVIAVLVHYRAENRHTDAEAGKVAAEATDITSTSVQKRYDVLFDDLQTEITRLRDSEQACQRRLGRISTQFAEMRVQAAAATADVRLARAEIVLLQQRLDELEQHQ